MEWSRTRIPERRVGGQAERPGQVRRVLDPGRAQVEQLDGPEGDVVDEVSKLKQEIDCDIVVYASYQLGRTLIEHDLVDELRLVVFPVVFGGGERLFGEASGKKPMRLVDTKTIGDGLVFFAYQPVQEA